MTRALLVFLAASVVPASGSGGLRPHDDPNAYPVKAVSNGVTVGAGVLSAGQVKTVFGKDFKGFIVVEVGVYPEGAGVEVQTRDFLLRGGQDSARSVAPQAVAAAELPKSKSPKLPEKVGVYSSTTVGYETGTYNGRRSSGVYTETGVGVGVGDRGVPPPAPSNVDPEYIRQALRDLALADGLAAAPIGGYLYFPKPSSKDKGPVTLTWYAPAGQVRLTLPRPK